MKIKTLVFPLFFVVLMPFLLSLSAPRSVAAPLPITPLVPEPNTPMMFIENVGQFDEKARFQVQGGNGTMWLADDALWITLLAPTTDQPDDPLTEPDDIAGIPHINQKTEALLGVNIKLSFVGANTTPQLEPFGRLETSVNYFTGNDPNNWHTNVPVWSGVRYVELYPGVDLEITSETDQLRPRLVCHENCQSALQQVRLQIDGGEVLQLTEEQIVLTTTVGDFILPTLGVAVTGSNTPTTLTLTPRLENNTVFFLSTYSYYPQPVSQALPNNLTGLLYGTFLGGNDWDTGYDIAVDVTGNAYIAGQTSSVNFPTTPGAFDPTPNGNFDVFVIKLDPTGSSLAYATFLGGNNYEEGLSIAVDGTSNAYVTGWTGSTNFPTTPGTFDPTYNGAEDGFVVKLNPAGSGLAYSTFWGGNSLDRGESIAIDGTGNAYVAGETSSSDFPTPPGAFDPTYNGVRDAFVFKINPSGSDLTYATFLGGNDYDESFTIAIDGMGNAYVAGNTRSANFPTTPGAFDRTHNGGDWDAFVVKLNSAGSDLTYATFLGGNDYDYSWSIAIDGTGNAYVVGRTYSVNFPTAPGSFDLTYNGDADAFVVKLNPIGSGLTYATFLGGDGGDHSLSIAIDGTSHAYVAGDTYSANFPTTPGAFDPTHNGDVDAFAVKLNPAGSDLAYATFLGGNYDDYGVSIAIDGTGNAYVTGDTGSADFPTTPGTFDSTHNGNYDAFVVKVSVQGSGTTCPVPFFSQRDPRWIDHPLRTDGTCSADCSTVGACGCTLTATSMLFAFYGATVTPATLSDCMDTEACPFNWGTGVTCSNGTATWVNRYSFSWSRLEQELNQNNRPVILGMHRTGNSNNTHWVLVISGQGNDPANYVIHDPWILGGANMRLSTRSQDYTFDWISVYAGQPDCNLVTAATSVVNNVNPQPVLFSSTDEHVTGNVGQIESSLAVTGTAWVYYMTEITMTIQLTATSSLGNITEMLIWTDSNPNTNWQPFSPFVWVPVSDFVYAQFRDEYGNESGMVSDSIYPVYTPTTFEFQQGYLPLVRRNQ